MTEKNHLILVAEDEAVQRTIFTHYLESAGYRTETASNGKEALEKALKLSPDLIILDCLMPEMNGFDVLKAIKESETANTSLVLMATCLHDQDNENYGLELGADEYIIKPVQKRPFLRMVKLLLRIKDLSDRVAELEKKASAQKSKA